MASYDALLSGYAWNTTTITYSFMAQAPVSERTTTDGVNVAPTFQAFSEADKAAVRLFLNRIAMSVNLTFVEVTDGQNPDLQYGYFNDARLAAYGFAGYPGDKANGAGNVWINLAYPNNTAAANPYIIAHEGLHALGLKHGYDDGTSSVTLDPALNTRDYSLLAGRNGAVWYTLPRSLDIEALRSLYGARDAAGSLTGTDTAEWIDGAGGGDVIAASGGSDVVLGMGGDDLLFGNAGLDILYGNQGNDTLHGGRDADSLFGGQGNDLLYGNLNGDALYGNLGNDTVYGGQGNDAVYGGQGDDLLHGDLGDDQLWGDLGNDTLTGGDGADVFSFRPGFGHDVITDFNPNADYMTLTAGMSYRITANGAGEAVIVFGNGTDDILLRGVGPSALNEFSIAFVA